MPLTINTVAPGYIEVWREGVFISRHSVETNAVEAIVAHAEANGDGDYELRYPNKVVMSRLKKTVIPFSWSPITASFVQGTSSSVNLAGFITNPEARTLTYAAVGTLPTGVTLSSAGLLAYNGVGAASSGSVRFTATAGQLIATSAPVAVTIAAAPPVNRAPTWSVADGFVLGTFVNDQARTVSVASYASDPDANPLAFTRVGGTAPAGVTINASTGVVTIPVGTAAGGWTLVLRVSDGALFADRTFSMTVDVVQPPSGAYGGYTPTVIVTNTSELLAALAAATPGAIIGVDPGLYTGANSNRTSGVFRSGAEGTAAQKITIVARYAAAASTTTPAMRTELRNTSAIGSVLGGSRSYIRYHGFYITDYSGISDSGLVTVWGASGCEVIGCLLVGTPSTVTDNNVAGIRFEQAGWTDRNLVQDCIIYGFTMSGGYAYLNHPGIQFYHSANTTIEHCTIYNNAGAGIMFKDDDYVNRSGGMIWRFNKIHGNLTGNLYMRDLGTNGSLAPSLIYQNLIYGGVDQSSAIFTAQGREAPKNIHIYNNTFYSEAGACIGSGNGPSATTDFQNTIIRDNIFSNALEGWLITNISEKEARGMTVNYNCGYALTRWARTGGGVVYSTVAAARSATGFDDNSQLLTASPFVAAGTDFKLNTTAGGGAVARVASTTGGPVGCYISGTEVIGCRL